MSNSVLYAVEQVSTATLKAICKKVNAQNKAGFHFYVEVEELDPDKIYGNRKFPYEVKRPFVVKLFGPGPIKFKREIVQRWVHSKD